MKWRSLDEQTAGQATRSLREIYAERKQLIAKYVPPEVQSVHTAVVSELKRSGIAERARLAASEVPEFELSDGTGKLVSSAELLERGPLVVCFIRGRWCPFCVGQIEAMNAAHPEIESLGASLVAISPQTVDQSFLMADQHRLRFPVLSDRENNVARQFGLVYGVPADQQEIYRRAFINLPFINGENSWELPIPATYIIGSRYPGEGSRQVGSSRHHPVFYAWVNPDYTDRPEPAEVIHSLAHLSS
jgi:peroxiredoxin